MSTLDVACCFTYRTDTNGRWRDEDYSVWQLICAIKGDEVRGYGHVPIEPPLRVRVDKATAHLAPLWFGKVAARVLAQFGWEDGFTLIPVPDSDCWVGSRKVPRTFSMAKELERRVPGPCRTCDCLRWTEPLESARRGGTRDASMLLKRLNLRRGLSAGVPAGPVLLVDDVLTTGGHLQACAAFVEQLPQVHSVVGAVCAAKAERAEVADPFAPRLVEVERFIPL